VIGANGLSPKTNKDTVTELTVLFKWFITEGYTTSNPFMGMRGKLVTNTRGIRVEKRRAATEGELGDILRNLIGHKDKRIAARVVLGMYTGMRSNEIA
jgi:integrase